jgi:DNA-binding IscR family transcriptional regulator
MAKVQLRVLDQSHRARILQFLVEAELVQSIDGKAPVISLAKALI